MEETSNKKRNLDRRIKYFGDIYQILFDKFGGAYVTSHGLIDIKRLAVDVGVSTRTMYNLLNNGFATEETIYLIVNASRMLPGVVEIQPEEMEKFISKKFSAA